MLSKEEALKQYGKSENPVDKFYYLTHALAELLLKKERRTCTEEEYFEALILCFYFLFKRLEEKSEEQAELMKDLSGVKPIVHNKNGAKKARTPRHIRHTA